MMRFAGIGLLLAAALAGLTGAYMPGEPQSNRNLLVNGAFDLDQANEGAAYTATGTAMDGWRLTIATAASGVTLARASTAPPDGFPLFARFTIGTGSATVNSGDSIQLQQRLEAFDITDAAFGTPSAKTLCLAFQARSSVAGSYGVALANNTGARSIVYTFALAANAWTPLSFVVPGDTSGTWVSASANNAMVLKFGLELGSSLQTATTGAWQNGNFVGTAAQTQLSLTTGATFDLAAVKLELGAACTPYARPPIGETLLRTQRQYEKSYDAGAVPGAATLTGAEQMVAAAATAAMPLRFKAPCRADPTMTVYSPGSGATGQVYDITASADVAANAANAGMTGAVVNFAATAGHQYAAHWVKNCRL